MCSIDCALLLFSKYVVFDLDKLDQGYGSKVHELAQISDLFALVLGILMFNVDHLISICQICSS